jgi:hypothetical protein
VARFDVLIERGEVCHSLRDKKMFYRTAVEDPFNAQFSSPAGPFWCARTQSLIGPDGKLADEETCRPGRSCCTTV